MSRFSQKKRYRMHPSRVRPKAGNSCAPSLRPRRSSLRSHRTPSRLVALSTCRRRRRFPSRTCRLRPSPPLLRMRRQDFWVGLKRSPDGGNKWLNVDKSSPMFLTSKWGAGMPNNAAGAENCVQTIGAGSQAGKLGDVDCNAKRPYYCMKYL